MIIGTCGFCSTGSSAVSDYLSEFDENIVIDRVEFTFPYLPDGLLDLEYHLTKQICRDDSSAIAIPRFRRLMESLKRYYCTNLKISSTEYDDLIDGFLNSIIQMKWKACPRTDNQLFWPGLFRRYFGGAIMKRRVIPYLNKKKHKCVEMFPMRDVDVSINPSNLNAASKALIKSFLDRCGGNVNNKNIVLDQPFPGDDPESCFHLFDNPIAIVVDRDPRDNYIFAREFLYKKGKYMPTNNVIEFVQYYKLLRKGRPYNNNHSGILKLQFEDLVYNYPFATKRLRDFCKLPDNPRPFSCFDPKLSIANTQLFKRFPQYSSDVKYIEDQLSDYLFDFDSFPEPSHDGAMFMGRSPLNSGKK